MRIVKLRHDFVLRVAGASVIVYDFNIPGIVIGPSEADSPLAIDPDAHLAGAIAFENLKSIPGRIS
jgi:hypothetical protein